MNPKNRNRCKQVISATTILMSLTLTSVACKTSEPATLTDASVTAGEEGTQKPAPAYKMLPDSKGRIDADYAIFHQESGVYHPLELPPFTRRSGTRYREEVDDFSFDYMTSEDENSLKATVYVYPNGRQPTDAFASREEHVAFMKNHLEETVGAFPRYYSDFELIDAKPLSLETQVDTIPWVMAEFRLVTRTDPPAERISWTYITSKGDWFIKYRISGPYDRLMEMRDLKDTFVTDFTAQISE